MPKKFHGFYYKNEDGKFYGLAMTPRQMKTMQTIASSDFQKISPEIYWKKIGRYMMTHTAKGYLAWEGVAYWIIGNCGQILDSTREDEDGINIVRFNPNQTFEYFWYSPKQNISEEDYDPVYDFVFTPWDWLLEGEGDGEMFLLNEEQTEALGRSVDWTDEVHNELAERWDPEEYWV